MKHKNKVLITILLVAMIFSFGVKKSISQVTDYDGNKYKTVIIGTQEWMAENLYVEHYRNGNVIPQVKDDIKWANLTTGAWCYYGNNSDNGKTYGKFYNWYAIVDSRGLAPEGWHIPGDADWTILTDYLGGEKVAGGKLKATILWESPNKGATNEYGFSVLPAGFRLYSNFIYIEMYACFWTTVEEDHDDAYYRILNYQGADVYRNFDYKESGLSVRCVKD
jgi:uncharacterized protein (TIGR02145 family)